ncbi:hypothetical protein [Paenibacillus ihuae]|uniref:hypothetical protein n=1 Tax=Paenibacillus ihuae TaxID=1232431 RepID=UPI0006D5639D|nr:hypothetical protein [Paenibacillus ihuae]
MWKKIALVILFFAAFILKQIPVADGASAEDRRVSISLDFKGDIERNRYIPTVLVDTIMYSTGERKQEEYIFEEQAFAPPQGFQIDGWGNAQQIDQNGKNKRYFRMQLEGQIVRTTTGIKYYSVYTQKEYSDKVIDEWSSYDDDINETSQLYAFDYTTKELKVLGETKAHQTLPTITYSYLTDIKTKEKFKSMDYWEYITTGTQMGGLYAASDLYGVNDYAAKTTKLFSLSNNTYITTVPVSTTDWVINTQDMSNNFRPTQGISFSGNFDFVIRKNGKTYAITAEHTIKEIKETKLNWKQYQWRLIINNHVFGKRWIDGWHYIINTDNNKVTKISERNTFVREIAISPDHRYLATVEAAYDSSKSSDPYNDEQVRIYDINKQKVIRIVKLPYRDVYADQVFWQSNTVLQYRPFASSNSVSYIRNVNIDVLSGIVTKDQFRSEEEKKNYVLVISDPGKYFSLVEPLQIMYKGKAVVYSGQSSFEGANGLVYCSVKDLAKALGAGISFGGGKLTLTLGGKTATVDLRSEDTIMDNGAAYAPIKPIITKLGLQYKRENYYTPLVTIE